MSLAPPDVTFLGEQGKGREQGAAVGPRGVLDAALVAEVVQRMSWGGDRRRGTARIELGGALEGVVIVVASEGREVGLEVSSPPGQSGQGLEQRIAARLVARGLVVRPFASR